MDAKFEIAKFAWKFIHFILEKQKEKRAYLYCLSSNTII